MRGPEMNQLCPRGCCLCWRCVAVGFVGSVCIVGVGVVGVVRVGNGVVSGVCVVGVGVVGVHGDGDGAASGHHHTKKQQIAYLSVALPLA